MFLKSILGFFIFALLVPAALQAAVLSSDSTSQTAQPPAASTATTVQTQSAVAVQASPSPSPSPAVTASSAPGTGFMSAGFSLGQSTSMSSPSAAGTTTSSTTGTPTSMVTTLSSKNFRIGQVTSGSSTDPTAAASAAPAQ